MTKTATPASGVVPKVTAILSALREANPHPSSELHYRSTFELLVAVMLSAQSTDIGVNRVTKPLFAVANTPEAMLRLGEAGIRACIRTLGLYNNKAKNLCTMSRMLLERFHGQVPNNRDDLESLPGVGRKTANVVLNAAFGQPTLAVDTHLFRVARRTGLSCGKTPEAVERDLLEIVPEAFLLHAHHWFVLHGRYVCKARTPLCASCHIRPWCAHEDGASTQT